MSKVEEFETSVGKKRRRGCGFMLGLGCLTVLVLGGLLAGWVTFSLKKLVRDFTASEPVEIAQPEYSPEQIQAVKGRIAAFEAAVVSGGSTEPLELSVDDLNALAVPEIAKRGGSAHLTVEDGRICGDISMPLGDTFPAFKGRYFNGQVKMVMVFHEKDLMIYVDDLKVKGNALPVKYMQKIRSKNWAEELMDDARYRDKLEMIKSLKIEDGKLIIIPKNQ